MLVYAALEELLYVVQWEVLEPLRDAPLIWDAHTEEDISLTVLACAGLEEPLKLLRLLGIGVSLKLGFHLFVG